MGKSVYFLCRAASYISHRRYIILAKTFINYGYDVVFIGMDETCEDEIVTSINDIKRYYNQDKIDYKFISFFKFIKDDTSMYDVDELSIDGANKHDKLMRLFIKNHLKQSFVFMKKYFKHTQDVLDIFKPDFVFYDIPLSWQINAFLECTKQNNIKTISLEHAEGISFIYSHFIPIADYYIAYGKYSYDNICFMGVPKDKIWFIGNIENDLMHMAKEHNKFKKDGILIILKPFKIVGFKESNKTLIELVNKKFPTQKIYVKLHPSVLDFNETAQEVKSWVCDKNNICFIDRNEPLHVSLLRVDKCITFNSYAVIESVMCGVDTICVSDLQSYEYPDWSKFKIFTTTLKDFGNFSKKDLNKIKISDFAKSSVQKFFRNSTNNVCDKIVKQCIKSKNENTNV